MLTPTTSEGQSPLSGLMMVKRKIVRLILNLHTSFPYANTNYFLSFSAHKIADYGDEINDIHLFVQLNEVINTKKYNCEYLILLYKDNTYEYDSILPGEITITFIDTASKIISGIFEFTVTNIENKNELLNITEGRFDLKKGD